MHRKWKSVSVIGMAVLIGCSLPMSTMMAAEGEDGIVQEIGMDSVSGNGMIPSTETSDDLIVDPVTSVEIMESTDAATPMATAMLTDVEATVSAEEQPADTQVDAQAENSAAPVIEIKWQGQNWTCGLGGKIDYKYINPYGQAIDCTATQGGQAVTLYQRLESVSDITAEAKGEEEMESLFAGINGEQSLPVQVMPTHDGSFVLYVKAVGADGQIAYARSSGIVIDTKVPVIKGVEDGKSYSEGTLFQVEDDNLESVTVNEKPVVPETDGSYRVVANGMSCVIKAKDKAGNETTYSLTISGKDPAADGNVISESGLYKLTAGTEYKLGGGMWRLDGDSTLYWGDRTFYVETNGNYRFMKR